MSSSVRVVVFDTDTMSRNLLADLLRGEAGIDVVACVSSVGAMRLAIVEQEADLLFLDVRGGEGPADGLDLLREAKERMPDLEVVVTACTTQSRLAMKALAAGAIEYVAKDPERINSTPFEAQVKRAVRNVATIIKEASRKQVETARKKTEGIPECLQRQFDLVLIGISTGGPAALQNLVEGLGDVQLPPVLIVQHMGRSFTAQLAATLSRASGRLIEEASAQMSLESGRIIVAPGGLQTMIRPCTSNESACRLRVVDDPPVNGCRPSVDVTWSSIAQHFNGRILAIMMTGMGTDGLEGMTALKRQGAVCVAQDEASSVVWGMPKAVADAGICDAVVSLDEIVASFASGCWKGA